MTLKLFISHSSHTEPARQLRNVIAEHLDAQPGIEVLWDATIKPGDSWRSQLDQWLAECNGGVILFTRDAIQSKWVLKEAQILTWRRAVASNFPLIPVLLDPVIAEETGLADWQPMQIDEIQFEKGPDPETMDGAARQALATKIHQLVLDQAGDTDFDTIEDPLVDWVAQFADELAKAEDHNLERAARDLGIKESPPVIDRQLGWARMIARRMLHFGCEPTVIEDSEHETFLRLAETLRRATHTLPDEKRRKLALQFFPMWVSPDAVRQICPLAEAHRTIAINARELDSGREYTDRATFGRTTDRSCFVAAPDVHDGDPHMIVERYHDTLLQRFYLHDDVPDDWDDPEQMARWEGVLERTQQNRLTTVFVVLHRDACNATVLAELRKRYRPFTFLLLLGPRASDAASIDSDAILIHPLVPAGHERDVRQKFVELA